MPVVDDHPEKLDTAEDYRKAAAWHLRRAREMEQDAPGGAANALHYLTAAVLGFMAEQKDARDD